MKYFLVILLLVKGLFSYSQTQHSFFSIKYFKNTEIWLLAKAVKRKHFKRSEKLLLKHPDWIDYHHPKSDYTLLAWMVENSYYSYIPITHRVYKIKQINFLVKHGANPYIKIDEPSEGVNGITPFILAAEIPDKSEIIFQMFLDSKYTDLLSFEELREQLGYALIAVCRKYPMDFTSLKYLLKVGADVNFVGIDSQGNQRNALCDALGWNIEIAEYLIKEANADYNIELTNGSGYRRKIKNYLKKPKFNPLDTGRVSKLKKLEYYVAQRDSMFYK